MSKHPSVKPSPPRSPPNDRAGLGNSYKNESEKIPQKYGAGKDVKVHGHGDHKSQFATKENGVPAGSGFAKPGTPTKP